MKTNNFNINSLKPNVMKTKNLFRPLILMGILAFLGISSFAQPAGMTENTPPEETDSVTIGSTLQYFVMPDPAVNAGYDYSTNRGALVSTFDWWTSNGLESGIVDNGGEELVDITWSTLGADILYVTEIGANCDASDTTDVPIRVINVPTAAFGGTDSAFCTTDPSLHDFDFPITATTDVADGKLRFEIAVSHATLGANFYTNTIDFDKDTNASFNVPAGTFTAYGVYTVVISNITDRISRKPATDILGTSTQDTYTVTINTTPNTGNIYHVPNQ